MASTLAKSSAHLVQQKSSDGSDGNTAASTAKGETELDPKSGPIYCQNSYLNNSYRSTNGELLKRVYKVVLTGGKCQATFSLPLKAEVPMQRCCFLEEPLYII